MMPLKVTLSKEVTVKGGCLLDMTYYPFDSQTCHLSFGSWSRGLDSLDLTLASNNITTSYLYARSSGEKQQNPQTILCYVTSDMPWIVSSLILIKIVIIVSFSLRAGTIDLTSIKAQREMLKENYAGGQVGVADNAAKLSKVNFF